MHLPLRPSTKRRIRVVVYVAAGLGALLGINNLILHLGLDPLADVHAYYEAGARLNAGLPLYEQPAGTNEAEFYRYPPLLAIAFRPLALLPFETAAIIWEVFLLITFGWTVWRLGVRRTETWLALGILALPIAWSLAIGQAQVLVTALLVAASPAAIALAAHIKLLPLLAAVYWVGRRDWRALGHLTAWIVALGVIQLVLEPAGTIAFLQFPSLDQVGEVRNISPYAISPVLWAALVVAGGLVALRLAPTRWGWAAAVTFATLATPRLLVYQLSSLLAALRDPEDLHRAEPAEPAEPAERAEDGGDAAAPA